MFVAYEKQRELEGGDELPEPVDVRQAREELISLAAEKEKTEKLKNNVQKELENAKHRAARIEQVSTASSNSSPTVIDSQFVRRIHFIILYRKKTS